MIICFSDYKKRQFTLAELVLVIVLVAVLGATVLAVMSNKGASAGRLNCMSNLKRISSAMFSYACQFNGFLPRGNTDYPDQIGRKAADVLTKYYVPVPEKKYDNIWHCPSAEECPSGKEDGASDKIYSLSGHDGSVTYPNYMIMTNWKGYADYSSDLAMSPNRSIDPLGPVVGDCINNWMGSKNSTKHGTVITGPHKINVKEKAIGGNFVFSDGHGKWFSYKEITGTGCKWDDYRKDKKYYWIEDE